MTGRTRRWAEAAALFLAGAGALAGASVLRPALPGQDLDPAPMGWLARETRALGGFARSAVLPFLWTAADEALRQGRTRDAAAAAHWLVFLLPESRVVWGLMGWRLAYDVRGLHVEEEEEVEAILAGVRWLETGARVLPRDVELCLTLHVLLQDRLGGGSEKERRLARIWRERTGAEPLEVARAWLEEARRRDPGRELSGMRLAANAAELARAGVRDRDWASAAHWAEVALRAFREEDAERARGWEGWIADLERTLPLLGEMAQGAHRDPERRGRILEVLEASRLGPDR